MSSELTILSFGGGQDSTAILYKLLYDDAFRAEQAPGKLAVVMSDTGDEHPQTYNHVQFCAGLCEKANVPFFFLTNDKGFHLEKWMTLRGFYRRTSTCGSKAFPKTCTDKLKIRPIYMWLGSYVAEQYDLSTSGRYRSKTPLYEFTALFGKIRVLIGIAAGEETRVADPNSGPKWMARNIERAYPLIDLGMDRKACQDYMSSLGLPVPMPSNCMLCPYMNEIELLWLVHHHPKDYQDWVEIEANKLAANTHVEKNLGVFGTRTLPEVLAGAKVKYAHMTTDEIDEYKMSHGHCVKSKY